MRHPLLPAIRKKLIAIGVILTAVTAALMLFFAVLTPSLAYESAGIQATDICFAQIAISPTLSFSSQDAGAVQEAIDAAADGGLVKLAGTCVGTYPQAGITQTVLINKKITLQGGYTVTNWITPDLSSPTVLDAAANGRVVVITGSHRVTLTHLHVLHGDAAGLGGGPFGGFDAGGGIYIASTAALYLENVIVERNKGSLGGGLYNYSGLVWIENSKILSNFGRADNSNLGGGIYNGEHGRLLLQGSIVEGNRLTNTIGSISGAGIYNNGDLTIIETVFQRNYANVDDEGNGGAINNNVGGVLIVDRSIFAENEAGFGAGIINANEMTVTKSTFALNTGTFGAGIFNNGQFTVSNSTLSRNTATIAGGAIHNSGTGYLLNSTIISNTAQWTTPMRGGGIEVASENIIYITNSIIAGNNGEDCNYDYGLGDDGMIVSEGYNLDSDGTCIEDGVNNDITDNNLRIAGLADNGGGTLTHALMPGSPAINAGNCTGGIITIDQRGMERPQGTHCDIGAFELGAVSGLTATSDSPQFIFNTVTFTASVEAGESPLFFWDFGDGSTGSGPVVTHTYGLAGMYTTTVTVTNSVNEISLTVPTTILDYRLHLPFIRMLESAVRRSNE